MQPTARARQADKLLSISAILAVLALGPATEAQQRWLGPHEQAGTDGTPHSFSLPNPRSGPTTIAIAPA